MAKLHTYFPGATEDGIERCIDEVSKQFSHFTRGDITSIILESISPSPSRVNEVCTLVNTKKKEYYTHNYDPKSLLAKLRRLGFSEEDLSRFDSNPRSGCCNTVSIALYTRVRTRKDVASVMEKYLMTIRRSIENVKSTLPDWIVRLYFDASVYTLLDDDFILGLPEEENTGLSAMFKGVQSKVDNYLNVVQNIQYLVRDIISQRNVEVYTYSCPDNEENMAVMRTYRFLPLSDQDVNVCAVREADGIVTHVDCVNLKIFAREDILLYIPQVVLNSNVLKTIYSKAKGLVSVPKGDAKYYSYSQWLRIYKKEYLPEYFSENVQMYDLLAGTFASRLRLKRSVYLSTSEMIRTRIEGYTKKRLEGAKGDMLAMMTVGKEVDADQKLLRVGYDEILLLELYLPFVTRRYGDDMGNYRSYIDSVIVADNVDAIDLAEGGEKQIRSILKKSGVKNVNGRTDWKCLSKLTLSYKYADVSIPNDIISQAPRAYFIDSFFRGAERDDFFGVKIGYIDQVDDENYEGAEHLMMAYYMNVPYNDIFEPCYP